MSIEQNPESNNDQLRKGIDKTLKDRHFAYDIGNNAEKERELPKLSPEVLMEMKRLSEEAIDEHNKENRERKNLEFTEGKSKKEPSYEINFGNKENEKLFKLLNDKVKEEISWIYATIEMKLVDRSGIMYNRRLESIQRENIHIISVDIDYKNREIENLNAKIKDHAKRMEALKNEFGPLDPNVKKEADKEKRKLDNSLAKAENEKKILDAKKALYTVKKEKYEKTRERIIDDIKIVVNEKIRPHQEKRDILNEQENELNTKVYKLEKEKDGLQNKLDRLAEISEDTKFKSEKIAFNGKIKEIRDELKKNDREISSKQKGLKKIGAKIDGFSVRIDYWNDLYEKVSKKPKEHERVNNMKVKDNNIDGVKGASKSQESADSDIEDLGMREIKPNEYIEIWNKFFVSKLRINEKELYEILQIKKLEELTLKRIEQAIIQYNVQRGFPKMTKSDLNNALIKMRNNEKLFKRRAKGRTA